MATSQPLHDHRVDRFEPDAADAQAAGSPYPGVDPLVDNDPMKGMSRPARAGAFVILLAGAAVVAALLVALLLMAHR